MPEHLRALVVILILAFLTFQFAKVPFTAVGVSEENFSRRRNAWIAITLAAFLAHNFWICIVVAGFVAWRAQADERNPLALYFTLLFAVPTFGSEITGLGIINHFLEINYLRLLALTILFPAWWRLRTDLTVPRFGSALPDKLLFGYIVLLFGLQLTADSLTNTLRHGFYSFIDVFLPYYVASRTLRRVEDFREAFTGFVLAALLMAPVAVFEFVHHWLLYGMLDDVLGAPWGFSGYLSRGESLRALVTTGQPIALGYAMTVALGLFFFLWPRIPVVWRMPSFLVLVAGIIAPVSRGPWVGAAVMVLVILLASEQSRRHLLRIGVVAPLAIGALMATPYGDKAFDYLPFVGTVDVENVTYRQQLFINSVETIKINPFFGASDFMYTSAMQEMRQGEGIIDLVNTFLAVALSSGLVGLSLFVGVFLTVLAGVSLRALALRNTESEMHRLGVTLAATQAGILVTISTVSPITIIPVIYWSVLGAGLAFLFVCRVATCIVPPPPARQLRGT